MSHPFVHLRGLSTYSMLDGLGTPKAILHRAKELGMSHIAITDLYGLYGAVDIYTKSKDSGVTPIIGITMPFVMELSDIPYTAKSIDTYITLLAKDQSWYHTLIRLISDAYTQCTPDEKPVITIDLIRRFPDWYYILLGGIDSYLWYTIDNDPSGESTHTYIETMKSICGDACLIDIVAQPYNLYPTIKTYNDKSINIAKNSWIACICSSNYRYIYKHQQESFFTTLAIKDGKKVFDQDSRKPAGLHHILSGDEIYTILTDNGYEETLITSWMNTTVQIAETIHIKISLWNAFFPQYPTPDKIQDLYDKTKDTLISE